MGPHVNDYFSIEGRAGIGLSGEEATIPFLFNGSTVDVKFEVNLKNILGVYGRLGMPKSNPVSPYIVAGFTRIEIEIEASVLGESAAEDDSDTDSSVGVGIDIMANEDGGFNVEYMKYYDKDGDELDGFNIIYVRNF